jgi:hypothetical protein
MLIMFPNSFSMAPNIKANTTGSGTFQRTVLFARNTRRYLVLLAQHNPLNEPDFRILCDMDPKTSLRSLIGIVLTQLKNMNMPRPFTKWEFGWYFL